MLKPSLFQASSTSFRSPRKAIMQPHIDHLQKHSKVRGGFTLVEMLVATTLVILMMLMFAQIYLAAISGLGRQQAAARNDAKARLVDQLLRGDLQRASFRPALGVYQGIVPLVAGADGDQNQLGFFYLSENEQSNPTDDVLHFTTYIRKGGRSLDSTKYFGRCQKVSGVLEYNSVVNNSYEYPNHPEIDDGDTSNEVGSSRAAEVVYFMRAGNLYRRVLLIRDTDISGPLALQTAQPSQAGPPTPVTFSGRIIAANSPTTPSFYKAFDYSAYCRVADVSNDSLDAVQFLGIDALYNIQGKMSAGCSMTRFGFAQPASNQIPTVTANAAFLSSRAIPVEYDSAGNFFGRPVHGETGSYLWKWPGERDNPLLLPLTYNVQRNELSSGVVAITDSDKVRTRATEDLLVSNVESFDVEVWDPGLYEYEDLNQNGTLDPSEDANGNGSLSTLVDKNHNGYTDLAEGFVQLGNNENTGFFRAGCRLNPHYGPGADATGNPLVAIPLSLQSRNWVFDTGHPDMWTDNPDQTNNYDSGRTDALKPPYRPLFYRIAEDLDGDGDLDTPAFPTQAASNWTENQPYAVGDVVFNDGDKTFSIAFRCTSAGTSGGSKPSWNNVPGQQTPETGTGAPVWEALDNRVGLKKIKITVRVRDPIEGVARQFSIVHSFVNKDSR